MRVKVTQRGMEHSDILQEYALKKFNKVKELLDPNESHLVSFKREPIDVDIILTGGFTHHHYEAEVHIRAPHFSIVIKRENHEMNLAIDEVMDIAVRDVKKHKEKALDNRNKVNPRDF
jgi:ribosomal subunit interface protein